MKLKFIMLGAFLGIVIIIVLVFTFTKFPPTSSKSSFINGHDYGRLTRQQIFSKLNLDFSFPVTLTINLGNMQTKINSASFSATLNPSATATQLVSPLFDLNAIEVIKKYLSPVTSHQYPLVISYDEQALSAQISSISSQIEKPYIPTELVYSHGKISVKNGDPGQMLDTSVLKNQLVSRLTTWDLTSPITATILPQGTLPTDVQIKDTLSMANNLIGKKIVFSYENQQIGISDATLISWLDFNQGFKTQPIADFVKTIATTINREPINAIFNFTGTKVLEFRPAAAGITVDTQNLTTLIHSHFNDMVNSSSKTISLAIPVMTKQPTIRTEDVNNLGIKELLGKGESTFHHSASTRNLNIKQGAAIVNRILVAPNEEFSFIKNLGEVSLDTGFQKAYIIRQGKTELDVGGGVCQVSTTLFRAMLNAGLPITARQNHAYRVSYYEEDSRPGFDATVFIPNPDLKFINDTGHYLLIQNIYDELSKRLTFEIYGTSDGRQASISNYHQWDAQPAPPDKWIDDPTLPPGKVVQDEHAIPGLKTAFDWKVTRDGAIIHQKTFTSVFVPWAAVYRRGL